MVCIIGCTKTDINLSSEAEFKSFAIAGVQTATNIIPLKGHIDVQLPGSVLSGQDLVADFTLSDGAQANVNNNLQISGTTQNNFSSDLTYVVSAANHKQKTWTVTVTNNEHSYYWGLGHFINAAAANDRGYEWYFDQGNSGKYSGVNCGPTSVTMAIKWADSTFSQTPEDARNKYPENGGWWSTFDVDNYLADYSIPHGIIPIGSSVLLTQQILKEQVDSGRIVIACIDMNYVRSSAIDYFRTDKFYSTTPKWGHFFVIKGYQQVDNDFYFQIYDPYSLGLSNDDGTPKGRNRFYHADDVFSSMNNWWQYIMVVGKKGQTLDVNTMQKMVDPSTIKHMRAM